MWYHHYLQHPGETRLEETLRATMTWTGLRKSVRKYTKRCRACQMNKRSNIKYGKLPTKKTVMTPWSTLCVDLIGPYTLNRIPGMVGYFRPLFDELHTGRQRRPCIRTQIASSGVLESSALALKHRSLKRLRSLDCRDTRVDHVQRDLVCR